MTDTPNQPTGTPTGTPAEGDPKPETFSQVDVDRIVKERVQRERAKYADYDALKAKAEGAKSLEDRIADLETKGSQAEERALRAEVANAKGLTSNQARRLVGATREELEADADELLADIGAQSKNGNRSPREGHPPTKPEKNVDEREFVRGLFGRANAD